MLKDPFVGAYDALNSEQKRAVDTIEGPVMVIAGPGTGKTSILTLRIANILRKTDTPANGILALTFTESGVHSMRRKLVGFLGGEAYRVHIHTFHGFAQEIISRYPEYFPRIIGGTVISDSGKFSILEEDILSGEYELIRPFGRPTLYVRKALGAIQDLKRDGINPDDFKFILEKEEKDILGLKDLHHEKGRSKGLMKREYMEALRNNAKNRELVNLYIGYEKALREGGFYDYDDMLLELVRALKENKDFLRTLQEEYLYILADEHQDANNSQNSILELLSDYSDTQNLFIVGDEKQAIYRFQGASLENFLYFQKKYPNAEVIFLDHNYRSTQTILDTSHALMVSDAPDPKLRPKLSSMNKGVKEEPLRLMHFSIPDDEEEGVAEDIKKAIDSGVAPEDIAVLVRTNAKISLIGRSLAGFNIPHTLFTDDDVLADSDIAKLLIIMRAVVSPENDELVGAVLLINFLGLNPIDAVKLNRLATGERLSPLEVLSRSVSSSNFSNPEAITKLKNNFTSWMEKTNNESALDAFLGIVGESGFQEYLLGKKESLEKIDKLAKLYDEVKSFLTSHKDAKLKDFVASIDTLIRHGNPISFSRRSLGAKGVAVMTAHKSKGLEWRAVYIPYVADRMWGNRRAIGGFNLPNGLNSSDEDERSEDERRLFYVALTRAKEKVVLSYSSTDSNGKDVLVSRFVEELPAESVAKEDGSHFDPKDRLSRALSEREDTSRTIWDREYLKELFLDQGLNATALNNYLACPWKYFFKNLVRLPDIPESYLLFGNAVHSALKSLTDAKRNEKKFLEKDFLSVFEKSLAKQPISKTDFSATLKKGKKILPLYYKKYESVWVKNALTEYSIGGGSISLPSGESILLRGRLDKIEFISESEVNVVDYKTGKRKTRNEILGETKNSNGDIKRQIDFYRLLLELHDGGKYNMVSAEIDFIEPDEKNRFFREHFEVGSDDALRVKEEVLKVAQEIISFSFWEKTCNDSDCEFCRLKNILL